MNLESYNIFLKNKLSDALKSAEENFFVLLNGENDRKIYRQAGTRDMLKSLLDSLPILLGEFYHAVDKGE